MTDFYQKMNIYEKMTANEEVYYSFLKNLQYVFSELERVEEDYSNSLARLLYFMNINNEDNDKFPALELRKFVINHLEKARDIHVELAKSCATRLFNPIKSLLTADLQTKTEFETLREKNDKYFSEIKDSYEAGKKLYYSQAEKTAKAYRDDINKKFKPSLTSKDFEPYKQNNLPLRLETIKLQEEWEKNISICSQKRLIYINKKKEEIKKYKEKNKDSLLKLNTILTDYFNIYHDFYVKATGMLEDTKKAFGNKESPLKQYDTMFDDISDWDEPPKFDFVPFISSNDNFFNTVLIPDKRKYTVDFLNNIRNYLGEFCGYQAPELFDVDPERRANFEKIQQVNKCIFEGKPENIPQESLTLLNSKKEYILFFLRTLNRNRPNMPPLTENVYKSISNLMLQFLDLCIDPNYKTGEIEQYYEILDLIISLSQSIKIGSDLLQDDISGHEIWKNIDLWFDIINYKIETEKVKQRVAEEKNLNERASKVKTIAISTIVTNMFNMSSFILKVEDKEKEKKLAEEKQKAENTDVVEVQIEMKDGITLLREKCAEKYGLLIEEIPDISNNAVGRTDSFVSTMSFNDSRSQSFIMKDLKGK